MTNPELKHSHLPYPQLSIKPQNHLAAYGDLGDVSVPPAHKQDLDYSPEKAVGQISVREKGGAVYYDQARALYKINVFQRSSWFFNVYPWNLSLIISEEGGQQVIRKVELCQEVKGARGELCLRNYLLWNLSSFLVGRVVDRELLTMNQALRIQCTHLVELVRYAIANFLRVKENLPQPEGRPESPGWSPVHLTFAPSPDCLLFADSEITRIFRVQEDDSFGLQGTTQEYWPTGYAAKDTQELKYRLVIPAVQQALGKTRSGGVKIKPFHCEMDGSIGHRTFLNQRDIKGMAELDIFMLETMNINPYRLLASTLKDVVAYLSLGQLFAYAFTQGDQRSLYEDTVRKNSFCIGWKPALVDQDILATLSQEASEPLIDEPGNMAERI